jgi:hypothetical protein
MLLEGSTKRTHSTCRSLYKENTFYLETLVVEGGGPREKRERERERERE